MPSSKFLKVGSLRPKCCFLTHLSCETVADKTVKQDNSIIAAFKVQKRLDLEDIRTGSTICDVLSRMFPLRQSPSLLRSLGLPLCYSAKLEAINSRQRDFELRT
jgi:hypothetical protein